MDEPENAAAPLPGADEDAPPSLGFLLAVGAGWLLALAVLAWWVAGGVQAWPR